MKNILIIGCGLLGSSLLRGISKKRFAKKIFVYEKSKKNLMKIKKLKLPGIIVENLRDAVPQSELITPFFSEPTIFPGSFNFLILAIFNFDFS